MTTFRNTRMQIMQTANEFNKPKTSPSSVTMLCIVTKVNEDDFTVEVFVPATSGKIIDVAIANNIIGGDTSVVSLPSVGQRGIVLLSQQHGSLLIATIPNSTDINKQNVLCGETKIGGLRAFLKLAKDNSVVIKNDSALTSLKSNQALNIIGEQTDIGSGYEHEYGINKYTNISYSKEVISGLNRKNYFKDKNDIIVNGINKEQESLVITDNNDLLNKLNSIIEKVENSNQDISLGDENSINALMKLRDEINTFSTTRDNIAVIVEKGDTSSNVLNEAYVSIICKDGEKSSSLLFKKDGTISLKCKDFIINKEVE